MTVEAPTDAASERVPLDEVMLAMDVVDTLRHERALVDAELDSDKRAAQLIARIRSIYASQGIEVTDDVIAEGVKALEEDRFTYDPPERTFSVRLAELYVERAKWLRRGLVVVVVAAVVWLVFAIPANIRREAAVDGFRERVVAMRGEVRDLVSRSRDLDRELGRVPEQVALSVRSILADARRALGEASADASKLASELDPGPDPETYPSNRDELDGQLESYRRRLSGIGDALGAIHGRLGAVRSLVGIRGKLSRALARLEGVDVSEAARRELEGMQARIELAVDRGDLATAQSELGQLAALVDRLVTSFQSKAARTSKLARLAKAIDGVELADDVAAEVADLRASVERAMAAGDDEIAERDLARLDQLVALLLQEYELVIVSGDEERSGVWRYPNRDRSKRNYYIIVEAIGRDGKRKNLRITSEETRGSRRVSSFGIRVPERVYEAVKADKLDNGLIDNKVFGIKKRGQRVPEYRFEVSGGFITEW